MSARRPRPKNKALRKEIIATCLQMNALGINQGTSGNVSARFREGFLITPSGIPYDQIEPEDIVPMALDGSFDHPLVPSSEWRFHLHIMKHRADVGAIVHTHSLFATTLAIMEREIPPLHYMVAAMGGPTIRCAPYATFGTQELSDNALAALEGCTACLLGHHGVIATGATLEKALWTAVEVETLAKQYTYALALGGPPLLPEDEIERVRLKMQSYGLRSKKGAA